MAKAIMIQGTMSNAGKSLVAAGLCRVLAQDGYKVAPFKGQNMALNSWITDEGLEMGRAQVVQAEAAGVKPSVLMNPVLLKPVSNVGSQVIVLGEVRGNMSAVNYYAYKKQIMQEVIDAYNKLAAQYDVIVIEGAGSPAEINLRDDDFVNMGMAKIAKAPVLLVGDIDRGGVFAQLYGTVKLLPDDEQDLIKGLIINKFRGDVKLLGSGITDIEKLTGKPVAGVLPMMKVDIEDEDSLSVRMDNRGGRGLIDIAVIRLPRISNFTDFYALEASEGVSVRYVSELKQFGNPDLVILPGTKNTIADLKWMRQSGLEAVVKKFAAGGKPVIGICGGYQMLGRTIVDAEGAEGGGSIDGMGLIPTDTEFTSEKQRTRVHGKLQKTSGLLAEYEGIDVDGYEIHMGATTIDSGAELMVQLDSGNFDGCCSGNVFGSYLHGFFDNAQVRDSLFHAIAKLKGIDFKVEAFDFQKYKEEQFDILADGIRQNLNMDLIYKILEEGV